MPTMSPNQPRLQHKLAILLLCIASYFGAMNLWRFLDVPQRSQLQQSTKDNSLNNPNSVHAQMETPHPWCEFQCPDDAYQSKLTLRLHPRLTSQGTPVSNPTSGPTPTPLIRWDRQSNYPPFTVIVQWGNVREVMEVDSAGLPITPANHPHIKHHTDLVQDCTGFYGFFPPINACVSTISTQLLWTSYVGGQRWDWIYVWVRDPDHVPLLAKDSPSCPSSPQYKYANTPPFISICQGYPQDYQQSQGVYYHYVDLNVMYESGVPPTPTAGATVTPPGVPACSSANCTPFPWFPTATPTP
jgi:hypothetical protein